MSTAAGRWWRLKWLIEAPPRSGRQFGKCVMIVTIIVSPFPSVLICIIMQVKFIKIAKSCCALFTARLLLRVSHWHFKHNGDVPPQLLLTRLTVTIQSRRTIMSLGDNNKQVPLAWKTTVLQRSRCLDSRCPRPICLREGW